MLYILSSTKSAVIMADENNGDGVLISKAAGHNNQLYILIFEPTCNEKINNKKINTICKIFYISLRKGLLSSNINLNAGSSINV